MKESLVCTHTVSLQLEDHDRGNPTDRVVVPGLYFVCYGSHPQDIEDTPVQVRDQEVTTLTILEVGSQDGPYGLKEEDVRFQVLLSYKHPFVY